MSALLCPYLGQAPSVKGRFSANASVVAMECSIQCVKQYWTRSVQGSVTCYCACACSHFQVTILADSTGGAIFTSYGFNFL